VAEPKRGIEEKPPSLSCSRIITIVKKGKENLKEYNLKRRKNLYLRDWIGATKRKENSEQKIFVRNEKMKKQERE
jgi:hypothetical protein